MPRLLLAAVSTLALVAAACGGDADLSTQSATEEGAIAAAIELQEAALAADADGIRRGLSADCLASIDDDEFRAAIAFMSLFVADLDTDDIEVRAEIAEFNADRAELAISYVDGDGEPLADDNNGFSLSADDMTLVYEDGRWVSDQCDFSGSGSASSGPCLDDDGALDACPEPVMADRDDPVPAGQAAYIGEGWMVRVTGVELDAAVTIEEASGYVPDLEPGVQAVLVDLELAFVGEDEPQNSFSLTMGGVGASGVAVDSFGCGFLPDPIDGSSRAFTGGVITGQQCLPTPVGDVDSLVLFAEVFGADPVFFDLHGDVVDDEMPRARGPVPGSAHESARRDPTPVGDTADVGGWTVRITSVERDGTAAVLAASEFNDEPEPGSRYVLIGYEATYGGDESASSNGVQPELLTAANVTVAAGCSASIDDEFDGFADVFAGGTVSGTICYLVEDDEAAEVTAVVRSDFFDDDLAFLALA